MTLLEPHITGSTSNAIDRPDIVINHATVREKMDFLSFTRACSERGMTQISIWEDEILKVGEKAALEYLESSGLAVSGFNRAGPFLSMEACERRGLMDVAKRSIDRAVAFKADHVLVFPGGLPPGSRDLAGARNQSEDCIAELLEHAQQSGIRLALEPLHPMVAGDRSCIVTMSHANDICDRLGVGLGIVIDVYHVWWDDRLDAEMARAGASDRIFGFHVNDWLVPTRHLLRDRGMMGDGIIDLHRVWEMVRTVGYRGPIEVEIFSDDWWSRDPDSVLDASIERCLKIFNPGESAKCPV
jgi:sugar phosphate isomerase/epimerase